MKGKLVRHFVEECKRDQEWTKRWASNHIEFDNFFKYSGKTEEIKEIISKWKYNENDRVNDLKEKYEKSNKRKRTEISSKCLGEVTVCGHDHSWDGLR